MFIDRGTINKDPVVVYTETSVPRKIDIYICKFRGISR